MVNPKILDPNRRVTPREKKEQEPWVAGVTVTTSSGKQYDIDRQELNWIKNRYAQDNADSYGYDTADQQAKAAGQMSAKMLSSYGKSNVDQQLAQMGLPSQKNLDKYIGQYQQWHTGGISQVFGNNISSGQWTKMKDFYKQGWNYENTAEDQERKRRGLMPAALEKNYTDTEIDDQLKASGLPSLKDLDKYNSQYWNYKGIDALYSNVAREWTNLRLRGIKNDGDDYLSEDKLTEKPGTQWYADAFFNELNRKDENGEDVYGNIKGLFKNRTTTTTEPDPSKDYVTELGKMVLGANKADALDEDFANYNAFSYDDFASHYDEYYDRDIKDLKVNETQTAEDALNVLAREEDEKAEKEFYTVDGKKAVKDFVLRYQRDYPDASAEKMFEDMYEHGLDDKLVKQAKKELQNEPSADKDKVSEAYTAAKVKSGQFEKEQAQLWDNINYDPNDRDVVALAKKAEEDANNKERVKGDRASLQAYVDDAIEKGADEKTVADITAAIEKALSYAKDSDEGTISPNDVISVLNGISGQEWVDATAMQKALEDYGFGSNGKLSGDAAALAYNWSKQDIRKVLNSIGSVRYEDFEPSAELVETLRENQGIEEPVFVSKDKKLDYEKFMHALDWANEQIANGMNEFDAYNTLAADGYQDELEAYLPEKWHRALYAHERVKEGYEAAKGDQLAWYEGLTDEEKYQHGLDIWNSYTPEQQAEAFNGYNWKFDPAVYRTGKQAWEQQFAAILPGLAVNLTATPVKFADMISANLTGREKLWETTEDWMKAEATIGNWGKVNDTIGSGVKLADIAADATQEVARMMVLGTVGGAIGHGTKVGQALSEVAGNEAAKWGVRKIAGFGLTMMTSSPFVVSATAGNFAEAKAMGASTAEATRYGLITGTLEGVLESLNFDELWGKVLGANSFGKMIMEGGAAFKNAGVVAKARIANMVASGLGEFMEESASYVAETFLKMRHADTWGKGTEWDANDWLAQAGMGFLTGMLGSGMSSGAITKDSLLYEYWNSNPATRAALMNTETATGVWNGLSATKQEKYRSGDTKVLNMDQYSAMLTQEAILDNTINAKAKVDYDNAVAKANKKYNAVKVIENNLRAEAAALSQADPEYASKLAKLDAKITKAAQDSNDASLVLKDETTKAQNTYEQTISNSRQQLNDIHRQTEEHYAALYLQNESAIKAKDAQAVTENVSKDMQNGATVNKDTVAEQTAEIEEKAKAKAAAEPTVSSIREAAYNRVYKDEAIGKQAAGEAGDGSKLNGLTRVAFADSERNNFQAKTSARFRRVTLELAGLELAKDGMSAKEIFAEAKKAMTPEAAQKLDVYTKLSKALGLNMVIRDVVAGTSGYVQDGKLYVTLNGKQNLLRVASHELTHYMKAHATGAYDVLRTHLINELGGQQAFDEMLVKKAEEYGYDLNTEDGKIAVDDEVCAELCEKMLENKDALERFANKDMSAAQKLKARLGRTLVAIKSAIRSIGTSKAKSNSDLIKEQDTVEAWYTALSSAIDAANNSAKAKAKPTTETATETEATTAVTEAKPEANEALYMGEEDARREQLKSDLEKLAEKGTKVKGMKYAEVNELLDSVVLGDEQNYDKADYARVRGMLAQLIPDIVAYTNGDENVDMDQLNEKLNAAVDYMLGRYYEANSDELTALREAIPSKISLTETAYKDLREAKEMTLREASRELSRALGKPVTLVYKRSPDYNNAEHLDTLWGKMENGLANGKPSFAEDVTALIDLVTDAREAGRTTFDDLYGSQREDMVSAHAGEFLDAVQSMVEGRNAEQESTVRFMADETNLTQNEMDDYLVLVSNALSNKNNTNQPPAFIGKVPVAIRDGLERFGVHLSENARHELSANDARHVRYSHGVEKDGEYGITDGDVYAIPYIIANADAAYYRETNDGKKGVLYVLNDNDSTYYVEGISSGDVLSGKQMIKAPIGTIPSQYKNDVVKEKALTASPDDLKIPGTYVQDVTQARASKESIPPIVGKINHPANFSLDDDYMPLAERYDAGIATDSETKQLEQDVEQAADDADYTIRAFHGSDADERFTVFAPGERGEMWFASTKNTAYNDRKQMYDVFLRILNPYETVSYVGPGSTFDPVSVTENGRAGGHDGAIVHFRIDPALGQRNLELIETMFPNMPADDDFGNSFSFLPDSEQRRSMMKDGETLAEFIRRGMQEDLYEWYTVYQPGQVKSADPVVYDDDGNIIPLSERFNPNETDIRNMLDDDWDALIQQYGAKPQGREPRARDVQVPNRASDKLRVSDFTRSLDESSKVNDELSQEIHSEIASEAEELKKRWAYIQKSNDETMRSARDYIAQKQPTEAKQEFHDMVVAGQYSLKTEAIGLQLLADAAERNDWQAVKELAIDLRVLATDAGQRTQLFNILKDLKGVGSAWYIESLVKKLNNWYADDIRTGRIDGPITVSEEAMNQVRAAKTQAEVDAAEAVVAKEIAPQLPLELSDKLSNWRYLSMLGNPVTHIRNVTGNTLMAGMNSIKDVVAAGVQRIVEKTGLANESDRSHALLSDADKARWENFAEQSYEEQRKNLQGGGKLGFQSTLQQNKRSFDNKYLDAIARGADPGTMSEKKGLAGLIENIKNNGAMGMLEVEDAWGLRRAYKKALMERMVAQGYTLNGDGQVGKVGADGSFTEISQEDMNKAIEWATNQAWTATFRGPSQFASMLNKISKMNTASKLIVEGVMPFKKTPINIAKTGAMYSPAGVAIGVGQLLGKVRQGKMSAAQAVDNLASGLTGTALLALGAMLAKAGILRAGGEDKKRYETYLEDTGDQTFSLKFGDYSIDLSAIAPATIPLFMGVALQEALGKNGGDDDGGGLDLSTIVDVAAGTLNPFMEMSFMSSLNSALKNYNNEGIGGALGNTILTAAQNYGSQYLPTIGGKVAQFVDPTRRTTKSSATSPIGSNMDYYVRSLMKKVPGVEAALQPDVDVWGRTDTKDSFGDWALDFANKFILPTQVRVTNRDAVDNELIRIVESTGEVDFLPSDGAKYFKVKGETYKMNAKQYTEYSQERGQAAYAALKEVMMSPSYQAATDGEKYNMLKKAIDAAYKQVNTTWKEKLGAFDK